MILPAPAMEALQIYDTGFGLSGLAFSPCRLYVVTLHLDAANRIMFRYWYGPMMLFSHNGFDHTCLCATYIMHRCLGVLGTRLCDKKSIKLSISPHNPTKLMLPSCPCAIFLLANLDIFVTTMAPTSKSLTEVDWLPHKNYITHMIHGEKLSHAEILENLESRGFRANKNQLENQLKKWNIRRKLLKGQSKAAWQCVGHRITKRKKQGKESKVVIDGKVYDARDVAKEVGRNQPSILEKFKQGPASPKSPEGMMISVCSPYPFESELSWPKELPWFKFQLTFTIAIPSTTTVLTQSINDLLGLLTRQSTEGSTQEVAHRNDYSSPSMMSQLVSGLRDVMPEAYADESLYRAQSIIKGSNNQRLEQLVMIILFQLSNNIHRDELIGIWPTILCLIQSSGFMDKVLKRNRSTDVTSMAVAEKLYKIAFQAGFQPDTRQSHTIKDGTRKLINWLLSSGQDPNVPVQIGKHFGTSLQAAVLYQEVDLALMLLGKGADPNLGASISLDSRLWRMLPLSYAISFDNYVRRADLIEALLENHADPNLVVTKNGLYPLRIAVYRQDYRTINVLLSYGAKIPIRYGMSCPLTDRAEPDMPIEDFREQTVLGCAASLRPESAALDMVKYLLEYLRKNNHSNELPKLIPEDSLLTAANQGYNEVLTLLLNEGINVNANSEGFSALHVAAFRGHVATCRVLLDNGALVDPAPSLIDRQASPLHLAAYGDHLEVVQLLHGWGADINLELPPSAYWPNSPFSIGNRYLLSSAGARECTPYEKHQVSWFCASPVGAAMHNAKTGSTYRYLVSKGAVIPHSMAYHAARDLKDFELISFLLENGQDPNQREPSGGTLLQAVLTLNGKIDEKTRLLCGEVASALLDRGAIVVGGEAVQAVQLGNWNLVERILDKDYGNVTQTHPEMTMIHAAFLSRDPDIVRNVIDMHPEAYDPCALCLATLLTCGNNEWMSIFGQLLENRTRLERPRDEETLAIGIASWYGNIPLLKLLLERIPPSQSLRIPQPDYDPSFMLVLNPTIVCALKPIGTQPTYRHRYISPLSFALKSPRARGLLLDHGYKADTEVLEAAISLEDPALVKQLLPRNRRPFGQGVLNTAIEHGNVETVKVLLEAGEDIEGRTISDPLFYSPLAIAIGRGNASILNLILERNPDVNAGRSAALKRACIEGNMGFVKRLIELGADINPGQFSITPLEYAAAKGRIDIIQLLLSSGANTERQWRISYVVAIALAMRNGHQAAAEVLKRHREWTKEDQDLFARFNSRPLIHWNQIDHVHDAYIRKRIIQEVSDSDDDDQMSSADCSSIQPDATPERSIVGLSDSDGDTQMIDMEESDRDDDEQMADTVSEGGSNMEDVEQVPDMNRESPEPASNTGVGDATNFGDGIDFGDWVSYDGWLPESVDLGSSDFGNGMDGNDLYYGMNWGDYGGFQ
ncbi:ankyrin repeat-containing domain protein [Hypoxylon sp. FL0890]|nr:ankyrin repeat-containing domain protein [Hypoxylon sp. FL0890]